jgi:hypothetical protein
VKPGLNLCNIPVFNRRCNSAKRAGIQSSCFDIILFALIPSKRQAQAIINPLAGKVGNATLNYTVASNAGGAARKESIAIAGQTFSIE